MALIFRPCVANWQSYVSEELELLLALVEGVERSISDSTLNFERKIEVIEVSDPETGSPDLVRIIDGVSDDAWDLKEVFNNYFPILHRKSFVITLYSFFEDSLKELCHRYRKERDLKLWPSDLKGDGILLYKSYLVKVVGLDFSRINKEWESINNVRKLRNSIVHNGGKADKDDLQNYIETCEYLSCERNGFINIKDGYLKHVLSLIENFAKSLYGKCISE